MCQPATRQPNAPSSRLAVARTPFPEHAILAAFEVKVLHRMPGIGILPGPPAGDVMPEFLVCGSRRKINSDARVCDIILCKPFDGAGMYCHGAILVTRVKLEPS